MAELTKVTTPILPRENIGGKYKPSTDQAVELNDLSKVNKPRQEGQVRERQAEQSMGDQIGRDMMLPLLRDVSELSEALGKMITLLQLGTSASQVINDPQVQELLKELFFHPSDLLDSLQEQSKSAVLYKGEIFDMLREVQEKFGDTPTVRNALTHLLKVFEYHVNTQSSIKSILFNCENILDYMFSKDRQQFENYLQGLREMILPQSQYELHENSQAPKQTEVEQFATAEKFPSNANSEEVATASPSSNDNYEAASAKTQEQASTMPMEHKEIAQVLKGNLLPLLGEIVVKYHQNERIRDIVMVIVHNIVRIDQGTPESLEAALSKLVHELRQVVNLPDNSEHGMRQSLLQSATTAKYAQNEVVEKLAKTISEVLHNSKANPALVRQAETLLISMLQNENSMMNILHFILPMQTPDGNVLAEMYVDPDSQEHAGKNGAGKHSRKIFLSFDSEYHGQFELSFVQTEDRVDFSMWCPQIMVGSLSKLRKQFSLIMQAHGYTMSGFDVAELRAPHNIAQVFPGLLNRRLGIDVRI